MVRRTNLESQPDRTLYSSRDFWPYDAKTGMERLAIRPGYGTYYSQASCNMITTLNVAPSEVSQRLLMTAAGGSLYAWDSGTPSNVTGSTSIDTGRNVQAAPYLGQLFVANDVPVRYDHATTTTDDWDDTLTEWTDGTIPLGNRLICQWANRLVLTGSTAAPHVWYMSRIGDPYSWLFAADDTGSPVAATDIEGGQISEPITSLIPHNRACIIFGTANSITVLRGNPAEGGQMERISHVVGPISPTAWCKTSDDWTYFLTRDGLYRMPPGCGVTPSSVSREKIPESLLGLDGIADEVFLEYDVRFRCIHIYVLGDHAQAFHYFPQYGLQSDPGRTGAFFTVQAPDSTIGAIGRFDPAENAEQSGVLIGTSSALKRLDRTVALGGSAKAFARLGPFKLSQTLGDKSKIMRAYFKFGDNTDDTTGTVDIHTAGDGEAAVALPADRKAQATIDSLNGYGWHPGLGGVAGMIVIKQGDTSKHLSYEDGNLYLRPAGKERA